MDDRQQGHYREYRLLGNGTYNDGTYSACDWHFRGPPFLYTRECRVFSRTTLSPPKSVTHIELCLENWHNLRDHAYNVAILLLGGKKSWLWRWKRIVAPEQHSSTYCAHFLGEDRKYLGHVRSLGCIFALCAADKCVTQMLSIRGCGKTNLGHKNRGALTRGLGV